ncbi:hypothetical protein O181_017079 [Austropuccinia psidii MF-1]|uniref:Uncharacterized protein n=1 Tax=Austropuccinia psidii MF-1 TaxID=1389203 RepID=A0A9Q3C531_9BASI|nr:hypothetical protein [Austropuccinia psidii MF-1]
MERMRSSSKPLDRDNELLSSSEEALGLRKARGPSEGLDSNVLQKASPIDKILVQKLKHIFRGPEEAVDPKAGQQPCGSSSIFNKYQTMARKPQRSLRRESKSTRERQSPSGTSLTLRIIDFQRRKPKPWTMCPILQEL